MFQCNSLSFPLTYNQRTYAINFNISITLGAISSCSSLVLPLELILIHLDIFYRFPIHKQVYLLPNYFLACDPVIFLFQQWSSPYMKSFGSGFHCLKTKQIHRHNKYWLWSHTFSKHIIYYIFVHSLYSNQAKSLAAYFFKWKSNSNISVLGHCGARSVHTFLLLSTLRSDLDLPLENAFLLLSLVWVIGIFFLKTTCYLYYDM